MLFEDIRKLFRKENWRYSFLVVWLAVGLTFLAFSSNVNNAIFNIMAIIGVFILLPLLAFLMFLWFLSIFSKKDIEEYSDKKVIGLMFISLPVMLILSIILFIIFIIAIILYFFFTSWFIIYGQYLSGRSIDKTLKNYSYSKYTRGLEFFGGVILSLFLIAGSIIGIFSYDLFNEVLYSLRPLLTVIFIIVGSCILLLLVVGIFYYKKGYNNSWLGIFFLLTLVYTYYLITKVILGMNSLQGEGYSSIPVKIALLAVDLFIIIYSIGTIWGSQAELLSKKLKYFGTDTILVGLLFAKVSYEFAVNFPYELLKSWGIFSNFPFINELGDLGSWINHLRNVIVLIFFILLLIIIGIYEIRKHSKRQQDSWVKEVYSELSEKEDEMEMIRDLSYKEAKNSGINDLENQRDRFIEDFNSNPFFAENLNGQEDVEDRLDSKSENSSEGSQEKDELVDREE